MIESGWIRFFGADLPSLYHSLPRLSLPGIAILPGLVNAHCHLEFSNLQSPIPAGENFPAWIGSVIAQRRAEAATHVDNFLEFRRSAIIAGIQESWEAGVRWVVDNVTEPWDRDWIETANDAIRRQLPEWIRETMVPHGAITIQPCFELMDINAARSEQTWNFAEKQMNAPAESNVACSGYAPHAPYTASQTIVNRACKNSINEKRVVTMHLAESTDELQWLNSRSGPFSSMLQPFMDESHSTSIGSIDNHLQSLSLAYRGLIAHGNYLTADHLATIQAHSERLAVVYCPRTHCHFGHPCHPMDSILHRGGSIFLGTDSRASNPDLNLWAELQTVLRSYPNVSAHVILDSITTEPASFLETTRSIGRIQVNGVALLSAINIESSVHGDPLMERDLWTAAEISPLEKLLAKRIAHL